MRSLFANVWFFYPLLALYSVLFGATCFAMDRLHLVTGDELFMAVAGMIYSISVFMLVALHCADDAEDA